MTLEQLLDLAARFVTRYPSVLLLFLVVLPVAGWTMLDAGARLW